LGGESNKSTHYSFPATDEKETHTTEFGKGVKNTITQSEAVPIEMQTTVHRYAPAAGKTTQIGGYGMPRADRTARKEFYCSTFKKHNLFHDAQTPTHHNAGVSE